MSPYADQSKLKVNNIAKIFYSILITTNKPNFNKIKPMAENLIFAIMITIFLMQIICGFQRIA